MTTTLRPTEPLQHHADGTRSRHYRVCVNSRPVGAIHLGTSPFFGGSVARIIDLRIEEPDRRRGRGTVAALAAEEVARGWGCRQIETTVPAGAGAALRLTEALGYVLCHRGMEKRLGDAPSPLPVGSRVRPMTEVELAAWREHRSERSARTRTDRGMPEAAAHAQGRRDDEHLLPEGVRTEGMTFSVLEHRGTRVGALWQAVSEDRALVFDVEADAAHRGQGHGRTLLLVAEAQALAAGRRVLGLNVCAGNTPAERLCASLGYATTWYAWCKLLL